MAVMMQAATTGQSNFSSRFQKKNSQEKKEEKKKKKIGEAGLGSYDAGSSYHRSVKLFV